MSKGGTALCPICGKGLRDLNAVWQHARYSHETILPKKQSEKVSEDTYCSDGADSPVHSSLRLDV
jgi:hypothetical protein